jgi:hypothetical protein
MRRSPGEHRPIWLDRTRQVGEARPTQKCARFEIRSNRSERLPVRARTRADRYPIASPIGVHIRQQGRLRTEWTQASVPAPPRGWDSCRGSTGTSRNGRFAETPEAKVRGYQPGRFSFNLGVRHGFEVSHVVTVQARSYSSWRRCRAETHGPHRGRFADGGGSVVAHQELETAARLL